MGSSPFGPTAKRGSVTVRFIPRVGKLTDIFQMIPILSVTPPPYEFTVKRILLVFGFGIREKLNFERDILGLVVLPFDL